MVLLRGAKVQRDSSPLRDIIEAVVSLVAPNFDSGC